MSPVECAPRGQGVQAMAASGVVVRRLTDASVRPFGSRKTRHRSADAPGRKLAGSDGRGHGSNVRTMWLAAIEVPVESTANIGMAAPPRPAGPSLVTVART